MPKAVLVMDMPERCDKCLLLLKIPQKGWTCIMPCETNERTGRI